MTHLSMTVGILALAAAVIGWHGYFWYREGQKLQNDGYLPPHPSFFGQWLLRIISKTVTRLFVGPVTVIGRKNAYFNGRLHILPNHQFPLDFMVTGTSLPYGFRHLGTAGQMAGAVKGTLAAFAGFFAVKTEKGKATEKGGGEKAVNAMGAALAMHRQSRLLTFPQGQLVTDNVLRPEEFRTGAIRAMHVAVREHGVDPKTLAVLPMAIQYLRNPRSASWFHRFVNKLGFTSFRKFKMFDVVTQNYGAVVVIGKPITLAELPEDPRAAIEHVRVIDDGLLAQAKAWETQSIK